MFTQKRNVEITLNIECYDDLNLENIDWADILKLEPDEKLYYNIKEIDPYSYL